MQHHSVSNSKCVAPEAQSQIRFDEGYECCCGICSTASIWKGCMYQAPDFDHFHKSQHCRWFKILHVSPPLKITCMHQDNAFMFGMQEARVQKQALFEDSLGFLPSKVCVAGVFDRHNAPTWITPCQQLIHFRLYSRLVFFEILHWCVCLPGACCFSWTPHITHPWWFRNHAKCSKTFMSRITTAWLDYLVCVCTCKLSCTCVIAYAKWSF